MNNNVKVKEKRACFWALLDVGEVVTSSMGVSVTTVVLSR